MHSAKTPRTYQISMKHQKLLVASQQKQCLSDFGDLQNKHQSFVVVRFSPNASWDQKVHRDSVPARIERATSRAGQDR